MLLDRVKSTSKESATENAVFVLLRVIRGSVLVVLMSNVLENRVPANKSAWLFFFLVLVPAMPFWVLGPRTLAGRALEEKFQQGCRESRSGSDYTMKDGSNQNS